MRFVIIIFLLTCCSTQMKTLPRCTEKLRLLGSMRTSANGNETYLSSVILPQMTIGQTICYDLLVEDGGNAVKSGRLAFISLVDIVQEYEFKSDYNFFVPTVKVDCECYCSVLSASCGPMIPHSSFFLPNFLRYLTKLNSTECAPYPALICCSLSVQRTSLSPDYAAVYVVDPVTIFHLEMGLAEDIDGELIGGLVKISLSSVDNQAATAIGQVKIEEQFVEQSISSSKWYFMNYTNRVLLTGIPINDLHERSLSKLGWYKSDAISIRLEELKKLKQTINLSLIQCRGNYISWQSNASYIHRDYYTAEDIKYVMVKDRLNQTIQVHRGQNSIKLRDNPEDSILLHTKLNVSANVLFQYREVVLGKFRAEIEVTHLKNHTLSLFMHVTSGWFLVSVESPDFAREVQIVIVASDRPVDTFKILTLASKYKCPSEVCIYSHGRQFHQCVNASCVEGKLGDSSKESNGEPMTDTILVIVVVGASLLSIIIIIIIFCYVRKNGCCQFGSTQKTISHLETTEPDADVVLIDLSPQSTVSPSAKRNSADYHIYDDLVYETKLADPKRERLYVVSP